MCSRKRGYKAAAFIYLHSVQSSLSPSSLTLGTKKLFWGYFNKYIITTFV